MTRLVVVLGYSQAAGADLHPTCAARVAHASAIADPDDVVLLSGWARRSGRSSEADLMRNAWQRAVREVVVDRSARTTVDNARGAVLQVSRTRAAEVIVVTSTWHAPRAAVAFRWLLRSSRTPVRTSSPRGFSARGLARELTAWPLLVPQLVTARAPICEDPDRMVRSGT